MLKDHSSCRGTTAEYTWGDLFFCSGVTFEDCMYEVCPCDLVAKKLNKTWIFIKVTHRWCLKETCLCSRDSVIYWLFCDLQISSEHAHLTYCREPHTHFSRLMSNNWDYENKLHVTTCLWFTLVGLLSAASHWNCSEVFKFLISVILIKKKKPCMYLNSALV